jgi:hypothetical protein
MYVENPRLDQLLSDPLIRLVMKSDGVADADLRRLARSFAERQVRTPAAYPGGPLDKLACCNTLPA